MRVLCLVPDQDMPGKKDMSGAFYPDARAFARYHGHEPSEVIARFPTHAPLDQRRATCTLAIRSILQPVDALAFFCHGWPDGLQAGYTRNHILLLARLVATHVRITGHVLLYACNAARDRDADDKDDVEPGPGGDGGFADELRDACCALGRGVTIFGHASAGHTSQNPFARFFSPSHGGKGGEWYVEPKSALWPLWVRALRDPRSSLRWRFWTMTPEQIAAELMPPPDSGPPLVA